MTDFFGDTGWDGSLEDVVPTPVEEAPEPVAEAPVEEEPVVGEAPEEPVAEERERDDKGRFVPKKLEVDDPEIAAFLDKYQGDPIKALKAATEAQKTIGGMANELGALRPLKDQLDQIQARLDQPAAPQTQITQDLIDQDPRTATLLANEQGNEYARSLAYEAWKEVDPASAVAWAMTEQMKARDQQWAEQLARVEQRIAPLAEVDANRAFAQVVSEITAQDPGALDRIREGATSLPDEVAGALYFALENGGNEQKIGAFKALNELTKGRETPATLESVRDLAREQALEADRAIAEAAVVSGTSTKTEPAGKSMADIIGDEWAEIERPLAEGWNIGR